MTAINDIFLPLRDAYMDVYITAMRLGLWKDQLYVSILSLSHHICLAGTWNLRISVNGDCECLRMHMMAAEPLEIPP